MWCINIARRQKRSLRGYRKWDLIQKKTLNSGTLGRIVQKNTKIPSQKQNLLGTRTLRNWHRSLKAEPITDAHTQNTETQRRRTVSNRSSLMRHRETAYNGYLSRHRCFQEGRVGHVLSNKRSNSCLTLPCLALPLHVKSNQVPPGAKMAIVFVDGKLAKVLLDQPTPAFSSQSP